MHRFATIVVCSVAAVLVTAGCSGGENKEGDADGTPDATDTGIDEGTDTAPDVPPDTGDPDMGDPDADPDADEPDVPVDTAPEDLEDPEPDIDPLTVDDDGDGFSEMDGDCDDGNADIFPGAVDHIEGVDYDCDSRREYLAKMYVAVDDAFDLCINGTSIGTCTGTADSCFSTSRYFETILESGLNVVGVNGWDVGAVTAAFAMWIEVAGTEITTRGTRSDEPDTALWRYFPTESEAPQATWCEQTYDASAWGPALFTDEVGEGAWLQNPQEQLRLGSWWVWDGNPPALLDSWFRAEIILPDVDPVWDPGTTPTCTVDTPEIVSDPARRLNNGVDVAWNGTNWLVVYDVWVRSWRYGCDDDLTHLLEPDGTSAAAEVNINDDGGTGTGGAVWWNTWPVLEWTGSTFGAFFEDGRHGRNGDVVYGHLLDDAGQPVGSADTRLESTTSRQKFPRAAWTGSEFGVVWQDDRDGGYEVYFRRVDETMSPTGSATRLTDALGTSRVPDVAWTGSEYGIVWEDNRDSGDLEIYFTRVSADGVEVGADTRITDWPGHSLDPRIVWTGSEFGVVWQDDGWVNSEIGFVRLDPAGTVVDAVVRVTEDSNVSASPDMVWTGSRYAIVWRDNRSGNGDIWLALVDPAGIKVAGDEQVSDTPGWSLHPAVSFSGSDLGIIWMEEMDPSDPSYTAWSTDAMFTTVTCP